MLLSLTCLVLSAGIGVTPAVAVRGDLRAVADSEAVLTVDALTHMTTFITAFQKEPDSVQKKGHDDNLEMITLTIGSKETPTKAMNPRAMAEKFPSIAADFKQAGLTPQQYEAYRTAIFNAALTREAGSTGAANSVLAKNVAFLNAHEQAFKAFAATGVLKLHSSDDDSGFGGNQP